MFKGRQTLEADVRNIPHVSFFLGFVPGTFPCHLHVSCCECLVELANKRETAIFVSCFRFHATYMSVFVSALGNLQTNAKRPGFCFMFESCFERQLNQMQSMKGSCVSFAVFRCTRAQTHIRDNRSCEVVTGFTRSVLCAFLLVLWEGRRCFGRAFTHSEFLWM